MFLTEIIPPSSEAVTLSEVKEQLRITETSHDAYINSLISEARDLFIEKTDHTLMQVTQELTLDCFVKEIPLIRGPVLSIESVKYTDVDSNEQTVNASDYVIRNIDNKKFTVCSTATDGWPVTSGLDSVRVRYLAGYDDVTRVPETIKRWMKMIIRDWFIQQDNGHYDDVIMQFKLDHFYV